MADKTWTPLMLMAQIGRLCRNVGQCPTIDELARHVDLPVDQVKELLDWLIDRRYVIVDCGRVYPWEAGPSPVASYRLSPEEIASRYGSPNQKRAKVARETIGCWPEQRNPEEAAEMPKGIYIKWPPHEELLAMANEIMARGGDVVGELAEQFGCSRLTVKTQLRMAKLARLQDAPADDGNGSTSKPTPPPVEEPEKNADEAAATELHSGELMQMAEEEAVRLVETSRRPHEPGLDESADTEPSVTQDEDTPTSRTLILIDTCTAGELPAVTLLTDSADRVPECPGDEWAQLIRCNGRRTYRLWRCVAVLPDGTSILIPIDAAIIQTAAVERRSA